jgi:diguanylate cyclase (GGDEF)-like protein
MEGIAKRPGDLSSRYGGEEFAIILPETNENAAVLLANRLRATLESLAIEHSGSETHDVVTVSVGVSTTIPKQRELSLKLISAADKALYDAKRTGRNKVVFSN